MTKFSLGAAIAICLAFRFVFPAIAEDTAPHASEVSPEYYKTLLSNEHVNIVEMVLPAGHSDDWHTHPDEAVYFIKGGKLKIHLPDGNVVLKEVPDGGVMWHQSWTHKVENVGHTTARAIIVEDVSQEK